MCLLVYLSKLYILNPQIGKFMYQAIKTSFVSPTNTRGARIIAKCDAKKITVSYNYTLNCDENHAAAANQLVQLLGWTPENGNYGQFVGGCFGDDYYFVQSKLITLTNFLNT